MSDFVELLKWTFWAIKQEGVDAYNNKLVVYLSKNDKGEHIHQG